MKTKAQTAIQPTREENFPEWYQAVVHEGELAEHAPVRGCMVVKPWGYALWENMQRVLDARFKATGHQNAYFPLFIPLSFLEKEAEHVEGFAKECAVVTHHRLEKGKKGTLIPAAPLEEPLIVRPTSEMMIGALFAKWVQSYRDLPLLLNQWANVVRWEMRPRLFLRTAEFLWQEGHTAHATKEEAEEETMRMLDLYADFAQNVLAIPVIRGEKTARERFPGAVATYTIEAMMGDGKALQCGTSHFLGQNFSQAQGIRFRDAEGNMEHAWTTSWGVTTRLIGALVMVHGDDDGLVLPPRIASAHIVLLPIVHKEETKSAVLSFCHALARELNSLRYRESPLLCVVDERDVRGGQKAWSWIKKGIPLRMEIGPRDIEANRFPLYRRDVPHREAKFFSREELVAHVCEELETMQGALLERARAFSEAHQKRVEDREDFAAFFAGEGKGFVRAHWAEDSAVEDKIKEEYGVTIRCLPHEEAKDGGTCIFTGRPSRQRAVFAKAY